MPSYQWMLKTPIVKDFHVNGREVSVQANAIRLLSALDDHQRNTYFVRFIYGYTDGVEFRPAARDDGLIVGGPNYLDLVSGETRLDDEVQVLQLCARLCGWDGDMQSYETTQPAPSP